MVVEASRSVSYVNDWWARTRESVGRRREALDVSMVGGPICAVTPPNASKVERIMTSNKRVAIPFS